MKNAKAQLEAEITRIDGLLAKWGLLVGGLGNTRGRRRELALTLAKEHGGKVTDQVIEALIKEGRDVQGVQKFHAWCINILESEVERKAYLPTMIAQVAGEARSTKAAEVAKHGPGDRGLDPSSREAMEREAAKQGKTMNEIVYQKRRSLMFAQYWGDGHAIVQIAQGQNITEEVARSEIDKEMRVQWDRMPHESEVAILADEAGMTVADYRDRIMTRFELNESIWWAAIEAPKAFKITSKAKKEGWEDPLCPMTLADWEFMQAEKHNRARAAKLAPQIEEPGPNRAQTIKQLRDAPPTKEE